MSDGPLILQQGTGPITADIVFVHGLRGDRINTWSKGSVCWPRDLLPKDLPNARIITWGYDADVAKFFKQSSHASIFGLAQSFLRDIARLRKQPETKSRPIVFVGHSMGGLLIKTALIRSAECFFTNQNEHLGSIHVLTKGVMFLGTPHRGSEKTKYADIIAKIAGATLHRPNSKLIEVLKQDSDVLEAQRSSFAAISEKLPVACIYETIPVTGIGIIVPESSACFEGFRVEKEFISANHMEMCKFDDPDDIGYKRVADFISDFVDRTVQERLQAFLNLLWFPEIRDREDAIKPAHAKSFDWLFDVSSTSSHAIDFTDWLLCPFDVDDSKRIFWVSGKAGSGKSTMMKYLYRDKRLKSYLELWAINTPLTCIGFFVWDQGKSMMHKSRVGMLRSLLHQILAQHKELIPVVFPDYATRGTENAGKVSKPEKPFAWNWSELVAALKLVTNGHFLKQQGIEMRLCIFVDGMDEYLTSEEPDLLPNEAIKRRKSGYTEIAGLFKELAKSTICKICLSSRPLVEFKDSFSVTGRQLKLEDLTYEDITRYTTETLGHNDRWRAMRAQHAAISEQLISGIVNKALGVFLWVELVVHLLLTSLEDGDRLTELQMQVDSMPVELGGKNGLYALMMRNIKVEHRRQCFEILQLVRHSSSPPTLLSLALADGECHDLLFHDINTISPLQDDQTQYMSSQMADRVNSRCAGLLEFGEVQQNSHDSNYRVRFMHQTAKDFVKQPEMWKTFLLEPPGEFNPCAKLLVSCILEMKLGNPLHCSTGGVATCMPSDRRARIWKLVKDAMVYASRDERLSNCTHTELLDELDRCVQCIIIGPWMNGRRKLGGLPNHLTHWATLAWETHRTSDMTVENFDNEPNFATYAAQHGLGLYITKKLEGHRSHPARKPLMIYALARCSPVECQSNPGLIELLLSHGEGPLDQHGSLTPWWELLRHPAASSESHSKLNDWRTIATIFARHLDSLAQIWRVVSFLPPFPNISTFDSILIRKDPVSPSNVRFVKQQLRTKAETLTTNIPPTLPLMNSSLPRSQNRMSRNHPSWNAHPLSVDYEYPAPLTSAMKECERATTEDLPEAQLRPQTKHSIWRDIDLPSNELSPPSQNEAGASSSVLADQLDEIL